LINKISNKILKFLVNENSTQEEKEILLFGITRIIEDVPKYIGIFILSCLFGFLKEVAIVTLIMVVYKTFTGGVHAKTNWGCFIYTVLFYAAIIYTSHIIMLSGINKIGVYTLIYIFCTYTIFVYVPADVPELPKVNKNLRRNLKIKSIISLNIIYIIITFGVKDVLIQNLIIYSTFYISLMTTRSIYKMFGETYGFETYVPDELI